MSRTVLFTDPRMQDHVAGVGHPEQPDRLRAAEAALAGADVVRARPPLAERADLCRVHPEAYVDALLALDGQQARLDPDTATSPGSIGAARLAVGAVSAMVDALFTDDIDRAFALVRPPGHHAEPDTAMGFCFFNNVAIAAERALSRSDVERVMIVDWDVHHGNGTQAAFYGRDDVLFVSTHQSPLYPGTGHLSEQGRGAGAGYTLNAPLPPGTDDSTYLALFEGVIEPIAAAYRPDVVLVSAGFDAHRDDPLAGMMMTELGFAAICDVMRRVADTHAGGRLGLVLEGGYDLVGLARSVRACVDVLGGSTAPSMPGPGPSGARAIKAVAEAARRHWTL